MRLPTKRDLLLKLLAPGLSPVASTRINLLLDLYRSPEQISRARQHPDIPMATLWDPATRYTDATARELLWLDQVVTARRRWKVKFNYDFTFDARLERMQEESGRISSLLTTLDAWEDCYPSQSGKWCSRDDRRYVVHKGPVETWRLKPGTSNERILFEMDRAKVEPADIDQMVAWLTRNAFRLRERKEGWGRPLFTITRKFLEDEPFALSNALVFWWSGHSTDHDYRVVLSLEASRAKAAHGRIYSELLKDGYLLVAHK